MLDPKNIPKRPNLTPKLSRGYDWKTSGFPGGVWILRGGKSNPQVTDYHEPPHVCAFLLRGVSPTVTHNMAGEKKILKLESDSEKNKLFIFDAKNTANIAVQQGSKGVQRNFACCILIRPGILRTRCWRCFAFPIICGRNLPFITGLKLYGLK